MKLQLAIVALTCGVLFTTGNALKCYVCSSTIGLQKGKTPGCSPGEAMNTTLLQDCGTNGTYCTTNQLDSVWTTVSGNFSLVLYELKCSSIRISGCKYGVYSTDEVKDSTACHKSCQTDGCNGFTMPSNSSSTVASQDTTVVTTTTPIQVTTGDTAVSETTTPIQVPTGGTAVSETTSHATNVKCQHLFYVTISLVLMQLLFI